MHFGFSYESTLLYCHLFSHKYVYFLQFVEAMGMFLYNKFNHFQWIVFSRNVFISLEPHLFGSVRRSHILHLAYCCIRRLMNTFLLFAISVSGTD